LGAGFLDADDRAALGPPVEALEGAACRDDVVPARLDLDADSLLARVVCAVGVLDFCLFEALGDVEAVVRPRLVVDAGALVFDFDAPLVVSVAVTEAFALDDRDGLRFCDLLSAGGDCPLAPSPSSSFSSDVSGNSTTVSGVPDAMSFAVKGAVAACRAMTGLLATALDRFLPCTLRPVCGMSSTEMILTLPF
jgi:hypothetical protein